MKRSERLKLKSVIWRTSFDIPKIKGDILKIEKDMARPDFWQNRELAQKLASGLADMKKRVEEYERFTNAIAELKEFLPAAEKDIILQNDIIKHIRGLEAEWNKFEIAKQFAGPYDSGNAILSIFSGAGGKDAEDWAAMLLRTYLRFAERRGFKPKILHEHWGELRGPSGWGIKNVSIEVRGPYAYGWLKKESGVHRLVRISPFSAKSLRHTSFVLVEVMPELVKPEEVELKPEEIRTDFFRSSGPGGQNVQKRETAVRIIHLPTGAQVAVQSERSQERNREIAMEMLRSKLYQLKLKKQEEEAAKLRGQTLSIEWGSQIRSYVLHPYRLVKDHRTGYETSRVEAVLDGELDEFIEAELKQS